MVSAAEKLRFGPYSPPKVQPGDVLYCEHRQADVVVGGWTNGWIAWPRVKKRGKHSLVLCGDLVLAVKTEASSAVAYWWGVSVTTIWYWRKALGVGRITEGTHLVYQEIAPEKLTEEVSKRGRAAARSDEARAKRSRTQKGRPAHPNTAAALRAAAKRPKSPEHREAIRKALIARDGGWTDEQSVKLFALSGETDEVIARELGISQAAVNKRRGLKRTKTIEIAKAAARSLEDDEVRMLARRFAVEPSRFLRFADALRSATTMKIARTDAQISEATATRWSHVIVGYDRGDPETLAEVDRRRGKSVPGGRAWTATEVSELTAMFEAGSSSAEIAAKLGRSQPAIWKQLSRLRKKV